MTTPWQTVRLDNGERVQVRMLNYGDPLPTEIEWPAGSGQIRRIVTHEPTLATART